MSDLKTTGGCLCGGVRYEYTGRPLLMLACHCSMCRKVLGAPFGVFAMVDCSNFRILKNDTFRTYNSSSYLERAFCSNCGGGIYDKAIEKAEIVGVNAGSIDGDPGIPLQGHIFVDSKACWVTINDGLPSSGGAEWLLEHKEKLKKKH